MYKFCNILLLVIVMYIFFKVVMNDDNDDKDFRDLLNEIFNVKID